jgi:radical SAM superfamily enzyme YgiQ (UPF0313 family)
MRPLLSLAPLEPFSEYQNKDQHFIVGLVHPYLVEAKEKNRLKYRESLALGYLRGSLEHHGFPCMSINAELLELSPEGVAQRLVAEPQLRLLGISAKSQRTYRAARRIAQLVKAGRPDIHVTLGGVFSSAADEQILRDCRDIDSIVRGEGEYAIVELAARLSQGLPLPEMRGLSIRAKDSIIRTQPRPRIRDLDSLPFPARHDLEYMLENGARGATSAYLVASRGCYAACTFCSIHQIYGDHNVVRRSPSSIADEMAQIKTRYGIRRFSFVDDLFIMPSKSGITWVHDFCDVLAERGLDVNFYAEMRADTIQRSLVSKLVNIGMHRLFIGMEAGVDSVLTRWDKGTTVADNNAALRELEAIGLAHHQINFGYIMFDPEMDFEELRAQYRWIRDSGYAKVQHLQNKMNIYWGTPQYQRMISQGKIDGSALGDRWIYTFDDPRVNAFEPALRRFHGRYESDDRAMMVLHAREAFLDIIHEDQSRFPIPTWLRSVIDQTLRRVDQTERACYYYAFEQLFDLLDMHASLPEQAEEMIWTGVRPLLDCLAADAVLLDTLITVLPSIGEEPYPGVGPARVGSAWRTGSSTDSDTVTIWLSEGPQGVIGVRCIPGYHGSDRYDNTCEVVCKPPGLTSRISVIRAAPQIAELPRVADMFRTFPVPAKVPCPGAASTAALP